jgi:nucleoside 2-deoxyribosyltransferase
MSQAQKKRIYLAGPMVFYPDPLSAFNEMKAICARYNLEGVAPIDNQMNLEGLKPGKDLNLKIVQADFNLMDDLDGGIFCLDPFRRTPEMDVGTAVEIGYMKAQGKPMAGWTTDNREYPQKLSAYFRDHFNESFAATSANNAGATSGDMRDPDGMLVHSYDMVQHGMAEGAIILSGGAVHCAPDWKAAFEQAAKTLAAQLYPQPKNSLQKPTL